MYVRDVHGKMQNKSIKQTSTLGSKRLLPFALIVLLALTACEGITGIVVDKQERNNLPRRVTQYTYHYSCGLNMDAEFECGHRYGPEIKVFYDRSGYVLVIKSESGNTFEVEVFIEKYRAAEIGSEYP